MDGVGNTVAVSPDHKCVFATDDGSGTFNLFLIDSNGSLDPVTHATVEAVNVQAVAVSPKGGVVFVLMFDGYTDGPLDSFSIGSGCAITEAQHSDIGNGIMGSLAVSPDGTELFASSNDGGFIDTFSISGTSFTLQQTTPTNPNYPSGLAVHGTTLFSGCTYAPKTGAYTYDSNGVLTVLPGSPATDPQGQGGVSAQLVYDSIDNQLISSEGPSYSIGLYAVKNGTFTFVAHVGGVGNNPLAMTQIGHTLLVADWGGSQILVYKVKPGNLTFKSFVRLPGYGSSPDGIAGF